jgi:hypothetical protein
VRDQVSHSYKTAGKIIVLYILIFTFQDSRRKDKRCVMCSSQECRVHTVPSCLTFLILMPVYWVQSCVNYR